MNRFARKFNVDRLFLLCIVSFFFVFAKNWLPSAPYSECAYTWLLPLLLLAVQNFVNETDANKNRWPKRQNKIFWQIYIEREKERVAQKRNVSECEWVFLVCARLLCLVSVFFKNNFILITHSWVSHVKKKRREERNLEETNETKKKNKK